MTPKEFEEIRTILTAVATVIIEVAGHRHMLDPYMIRDFARHADFKEIPEP